MTEFQTDSNNVHRNDDIDSKIADFMADIDEIVLGKKSNHQSDESSEWKQCFDETSQSIYYWNVKTNVCSWDPPPASNPSNGEFIEPINPEDNGSKKRSQIIDDHQSPKKMKQTSLIAEYDSSESEEEENVDDIDELLNEVLEKEDKPQQIDLYPLFEMNYRAAIARLVDLGDRTAELFTLRIQLQTRLEDCLAGHLSKAYAVDKFEQALIIIDEFEKSQLISIQFPAISEVVEPQLTSSEMALLLSLPPPPPPPSPPASSTVDDDQALQLFYAQLNCDQPEAPDMEKTSTFTKSDQHQHHHHKEKKSKPSKTLPTDLIQKWAHARQELRGIGEMSES